MSKNKHNPDVNFKAKDKEPEELTPNKEEAKNNDKYLITSQSNVQFGPHACEVYTGSIESWLQVNPKRYIIFLAKL